MGTPAGRFSQRLRFEQRSAGEDDFGTEKDEWEAFEDRRTWAVYGSGQERREAAQQNASASATFRVRKCSRTSQITAAFRLRHDPVHGAAPLEAAPVWDIASVVPARDDPSCLDIAAVMKAT